MPERSPFEDLARGALLEITPASTVGEYVGTTDEGDGVVSVLFASAQPGYPDWRWTVSIAQVEGEEPTVREAELMPAEGALLAPDWVPWSDRLADYKAAQEPDADDEESEDSDDDSDDDDDESDDEEVESEDDDDDLGSDILHGGDVDGVDIDEVDVSGEESDDDEESDEDDDEREKNY